VSVAYVVLAHQRPGQLLRLLRRLESGGGVALVHYDRRSDDAEFAQLQAAAAASRQIVLLERQACRWGGFSLVAVMLRALRELRARGDAFSHAIFLSGQDYPLMSAARIETVLAERAGTSFLSWHPLPWSAWGARGGLDRIEYWHLEAWHRVRARTLRVRPPRRRRLPSGLQPFGGSAHWCLARQAVDYVDELVLRRRDIVRFFRHVWIPDELFFQTVLLSSTLADTVVGETLHHTSWSPGRARPNILTAADLPYQTQA